MTALRGAVGDKTESIGIDSWAVDFGLFDAQGMLLGNPGRLPRCETGTGNDGIPEENAPGEAYELTGISIGYVNSVFQLYRSHKK